MSSPFPSQGNNDFRALIVHVVVTVVFGIGLLVIGHMSGDSLQTVIIVAAPVVVLIGAVTMLFRTYRVWKRGGRWQMWQGGSWFLLAFFIVTLFNSAPVLFD